jgi:tRNA-splicing ligase RtcB
MKHLNDKLVSWASILEEQTQDQAVLTSTLPFIYPHIALMPDAHLGKGATVGSVIPTDGAIIPAAVGVDIGCGMIAVRTQISAEALRDHLLPELREGIEVRIPLSPGMYNTDLSDSAKERTDELEMLAFQQWKGGRMPHDYAGNWKLQLGSLGGGNHFCEVTEDENGDVWLFLHSGSRGIGNKIATWHIKKARKLMEKYFITLPDPDLAYLVEHSDEFWHYITEMRWAQHFAQLNREEMMDRVIDALEEHKGEEVHRLETINCHHNYTEQERHFGRDLWVSRKGAINAEAGAPGLIPGSMGTASYVVEGKGNRVSLNSAPHGAGRNFSRKRARETFSMAELEQAMSGIEWRRSEAFLDEIPGAYKDIDQVMADASPLVEVKHTLRQIINVKGE